LACGRKERTEDGDGRRGVLGRSGSIDACHVTQYTALVIRSFADRQTEQLWVTGRLGKLPADIERRALRKLSSVDAADRLEALRVPPGNRLHSLEGDRAGRWSISINDQWRICFRFEQGDAYDVEVCDYH
jgi:proteic killer suppression protein